MDLLYLFHSLLRKKWIIIFSTFVGIAAGVAFALTLKKTYTAIAQYSTGFTMGKKIKIQSDEAFNIFEIDFQFKNVMETFRSPVVLGMVGYKLMLHDLESDHPYRTLKAEDRQNSRYKSVSQEKLKSVLRSKIATMQVLSNYDPEEKKMWEFLELYGYDQETLMKHMLVERVSGTDYLNIWFRSENPELSAFVVNDVGNEFQDFFSKITSTRTNESVAKLDSLTKAKKAELDDLNEKYKKYRDKLGARDISGKSEGVMNMLQDATTSYTNEKANLNKYTTQLTAVEEQLRELSASSGNSGTGAPVNNNVEILRLQKENNDLRGKLTEKGGNDPEIENQITENTRKILQLRPTTSGSNRQSSLEEKKDKLLSTRSELKAQIASAEQNLRLYEQNRNTYEAIANQGGGETVTIAAFDNQIKRVNDEYNRLVLSQQSAQDINIAPEINFKQTMIGQPPIQPDPAHRSIIVAAAGAAMFVFTTVLILLLDLMDGSLKTPSVFLRNTRLKLLSSLNRIDLRKKEVLSYFSLNNGQLSPNAAVFIENIRKLRFEIETTGKKIFLFTSNKTGEGKSTVIEALAFSFSLSKKKVLLIDANFSNNTLTKKFDAKPLLEQFSLNGERNAVEKFWGITSMTSIPNVEIVGCNESHYTPEEILPKNNLLDNIKEIAEQYDYIFIEGAALNTHADSKELSKYVDGIVSVFSSRSVLRQTDKESIHFLRTTGNKYVGAVLNGVEAENIDL